MHHTNPIARRLDIGFGAGHARSRLESRGTINSNWLAAKRYAPPLANSALLARLVPSSIADDTSDCGCGCSGGAASEIGASADITRSGGKVPITSVPMRRFAL